MTDSHNQNAPQPETNAENPSRGIPGPQSDKDELRAPPPPPSSRPRRQKSHSGCLIALAITVILAICGLAVLMVGGVIFSAFGSLGTPSTGPRIQEQVVQAIPGATKKIVIIDVKGIIRSDAGYRGADPHLLSKQISKAIEDSKVQAVVLDLNTPGGEVTASDEIHQAVQQLCKTGKPVIGCMRSVCASGGYYIASACDHLVANRITLTGSIGVIFPHFTYRELLDKIGVQQTPYTSGKLKDMFSGGVERSESEQQLVDMRMQQLVDETFARFLHVVAQGRKEYASVAELKNAPFTDGRVLLGETALEYGLVDQLGYMKHAIEKARELADAYDTNIVRYRESISLTELLLMKTGEQHIKVEGLPKVMPTLNPHNLYYLMQPLGE